MEFRAPPRDGRRGRLRRKGGSSRQLSAGDGNVTAVGYREFAAPPPLRGLVECGWIADGPGGPVQVLPDGCMDLIRLDGTVNVAGPDTAAATSARSAQPTAGLRFRPGVLPRLLGVPASVVRDTRVPLADVRRVPPSRSLTGLATALAGETASTETAPWTLPVLDQVTRSLAGGASVTAVADRLGRSNRSLQRQCDAVFGYGPAMLRRVLRFRRAVTMLRDGVPFARVAADAGYSDQPHLHREARALSGLSLGQLGRGANRSTEVPSGSVTVA